MPLLLGSATGTKSEHQANTRLNNPIIFPPSISLFLFETKLKLFITYKREKVRVNWKHNPEFQMLCRGPVGKGMLKVITA